MTASTSPNDTDPVASSPISAANDTTSRRQSDGTTSSGSEGSATPGATPTTASANTSITAYPLGKRYRHNPYGCDVLSTAAAVPQQHVEEEDYSYFYQNQYQQAQHNIFVAASQQQEFDYDHHEDYVPTTSSYSSPQYQTNSYHSNNNKQYQQKWKNSRPQFKKPENEAPLWYRGNSVAEKQQPVAPQGQKPVAPQGLSTPPQQGTPTAAATAAGSADDTKYDDTDDSWIKPPPPPNGTLHQSLMGRMNFISYPAEEFLSSEPTLPKSQMVRMFIGQLPYNVTEMQLSWILHTFGAGANMYHFERITKTDHSRGGIKVPSGCFHCHLETQQVKPLMELLNDRLLVDDTGIWVASATDKEDRALLARYCQSMKIDKRRRFHGRPYGTVVAQVATSNYDPDIAPPFISSNHYISSSNGPRTSSSNVSASG